MPNDYFKGIVGRAAAARMYGKQWHRYQCGLDPVLSTPLHRGGKVEIHRSMLAHWFEWVVG